MTKASKAATLRTAWSWFHFLRRAAAFDDASSSAESDSCLLVGKITINVNGTTKPWSAPAMRTGMPRPFSHARNGLAPGFVCRQVIGMLREGVAFPVVTCYNSHRSIPHSRGGWGRRRVVNFCRGATRLCYAYYITSLCNSLQANTAGKGRIS